jgi:hypothetical protein
MATRTIATPDPGFSGTRAGVIFRDGRGEVDSDDASALAYFARHGYPVDTPAPARRGRAKAKAAEPQDHADVSELLVEADPGPDATPDEG